MTPEEKVALHNCDSEPVHIPGRIQPFAAVLGYELSTGQLQYHSDNLASVLGIDSVSIGGHFEQLIREREIIHAIRGATGLPTIREQRDRAGVFMLDDRKLDVSVYATQTAGIVELEVDLSNETRPQSPVSMVRSMMSAVVDGQGVEALLQSAVRALRHLTGHDRVLGYKMFDNGDGEAVAEAKAPGIEPYLGLRYPAWDIPTQVRQVMLRAPFRIVPDIHAEQSALIAQGGVPPLDLTLSHTRGVSPIYVEYIANMGVRATLTLSLIVRGRLWGMFALHHYRPRPLTPDQRSICELFAHLVSMMLQQEEERARLTLRQRTRSTIDSMATEPNAEAVLRKSATALMDTVTADGIAIIQPQRVNGVGDVPADEVCQQLTSKATEDLMSVDSLISAQSWPDPAALGQIAGVLMLRLPRDAWLAFFRKEVLQTIRWAGPKEKEISIGPHGPRLTPRGSFAEYKESVSGRCEAWTEADINAASEISSEFWKLAQLSSDEQTQQLERQKQYKDLLIAELNHRVRNTLALVRSIARQTTASSVSVENYVDMLEQRISALSKAHDLIGGSGLQWARITDLISAELKPFEFDQQRVTIEGPATAVRADVAPVLALLFHEMTSNAAKHGALSEVGGKLLVRWYDEAGGVAIQWLEQMQQPVSEPDRTGFGFALIERALPYECNGKSSIRFRGNQLQIEFWLPAETVDRLAEREQVVTPKQRRAESALTLDLSHIDSALVVEDNMVLAMELERMLQDLGVQTVDTLPNAELAKEVVEKQIAYGFAVLDINLGDDNSFDIALGLKNAGIAVVLASGYDSNYTLPSALVGVPRLTKPVGRVELVNAIHQACKAHGT